MGGNSTGCPVHHLPDDPEPFLTGDGNFNIKLHYVGWIVAGFFGLIGSGASFWLIKKHLEFYTKPTQQKYIVRILFMVPCYAAYSWFSYYWCAHTSVEVTSANNLLRRWKEALYFQLLRDCYEAVVIASFFSLLLYYLGDNEEEHALVFRNVQFKKWIWPFGRWRYKPSGPRFLSIMQWSIGQYWICRPGCTLGAVITEAFDLYCLDSWSPRFSHVWTSTVICISVTIAMYAVLQFYVTMKVELAPFQPMLKFFAVKAVVFLTFWGECMLIVLASIGVIKGNNYWSAHEIQVGISAVLSCFVMMIFGFFHVKSFTYLPYRGESLDPKERKFNKTKILPALGNVLDFRDVGRDIWTGTKQFFRLCTGKKVEKSFIVEEDHFGNALGRARITKTDCQESTDATKVLMKEKTDVEEELERVKLSLEKDADQAFLSGGSPRPGRAESAFASPWQNTTTAFTPLINSTRSASPAPSSAICIAPTTSIRSNQIHPTSFGDIRRFPKSSTGILFPDPPPDSSVHRTSIEFPEKIEGDAGEMVYDKSTSWFKRVFHGSGRFGHSQGRHTPLQPAYTSRNDPVIDEILEDRSMSYDYPNAALAGESHPNQEYSSDTPKTSDPRETITTRIGRTYQGYSPTRSSLKMPNPLSPSRYPGFDEQAHVDNMYALHAAALNVVSPQPAFPPSQPQVQGIYTAAGATGEFFPTYPVEGSRIKAQHIQPPQRTSQVLDSLGRSGMRLPRHDLPPAKFEAILPPNLSDSASRRPLNAASSKRQYDATLQPSLPLALGKPLRAEAFEEPPNSEPNRHNASSSNARNVKAPESGLGLSLGPTDQILAPRNTSGRRETHFVYDEY